MKKIVFGITSMEMGGAEKTLVDLVNHLKDDYDITILTIYGDGVLLSQLDDKIKVTSIFKKKYEDLSILKRKLIALLFIIKPILGLMYRIYLLNKFDTEVAFLEGPITNLFSVNTGKRKIAWVHTDFSTHYKNNDRRYKKWYDSYDKVIFVSDSAKQGFKINIGDKGEVIHNYIDAKRIISLADDYRPREYTGNHCNFVSVGRLVPVKGYAKLIDVAKKLKDNNLEYKIFIIGDGEERKNLEEKILTLGLEKNVFLLGLKDNPYPYIKNANAFVLASEYEGYPTVAVEAMILNQRVISTNTGAKEALNNYENKVIVKHDINDIYKAMAEEIKKPASKKSNNKHFEPEDVIKRIKEIL